MGKTGPFLFLERTSRCQPLQTEDNAKPCVRPPSRPGHTASLGVSQRVTPIQHPGPPGTHSQQEWRETGSRPASPPTPPPRVSGSTAAHFRSPLPGWDHTARCGLCLGQVRGALLPAWAAGRVGEGRGRSRTVAAPQPGLGRGVGAALSREARGHPAGPAESAGSSRASSGPRPESLAPREAGASSVRFPVFLSRPFRISPSPLRTPSLVIHRGNRAKEAVGQWPRHTTEGR